MTSLVLSILYLDTISTGFVAITEKKVSFFGMGKKLFPQFVCFDFFMYIKSLYDSYLPFIYILLISFFKQLILNKLSVDILTIIAKGIFGKLILTKLIDSLLTLIYCLFFVTKWSISSAHTNHMFYLLLSVSTSVSNHCYRYSNTLIEALFVLDCFFLAMWRLVGITFAC